MLSFFFLVVFLYYICIASRLLSVEAFKKNIYIQRRLMFKVSVRAGIKANTPNIPWAADLVRN